VQLEKATAAAQRFGGVARRIDVARECDWTALEEDSEAAAADILVNNAGINPGPRAFESHALDEWRHILAVNLDGTFLGCRHALRTMAGRGGAVVNIASAAAKRVSGTMPAYCASKAGVLALTKAVAVYCGAKKLPIRCNAISPGSVETPLVDRLRRNTGDAEAARARTRAAHTVGFVGAPSDIAAAALYLVSDEARFVTGADFAIDGGLTLGAG
jgi:3(or 17)beta-hydroxysteroid dehydrogenase